MLRRSGAGDIFNLFVDASSESSQFDARPPLYYPQPRRTSDSVLSRCCRPYYVLWPRLALPAKRAGYEVAPGASSRLLAKPIAKHRHRNLPDVGLSLLTLLTPTFTTSRWHSVYVYDVSA